jgi:hypothetical protein
MVMDISLLNGCRRAGRGRPARAVNTPEGFSAGPLQKGDDADRSSKDRSDTMAAKLPAH